MDVKYGDLLSSCYQVTEKIGAGVSSNIFTAFDRRERIYAVKVEKFKNGELLKEKTAYENIQLDESGNQVAGIPRMFYFGLSHGQNFIAMELLGCSVLAKMGRLRGMFCADTVLMIAIRVISILEHVHNCGFIHLDVKPNNILTGLTHRNKELYLIDYGLAERYQDAATKVHKAYNEGAGLLGSVRYGSINVLKGIQGSRRDDLESLAYSLYELRWGYLPWKERSPGFEFTAYKEAVLQKKQEIDIQEFSFKIPGLKEYMTYVKEMDFTSKPDYRYLRECFENGLTSMGLANDGNFEWMRSR